MMGRLAVMPAAAVASALALAGCGGGSFGGLGGFGGGSPPPPDPATVQPLPAPEIPASIRSSEVVGRWGYAAYHKPEDRPRTETAARGQCNHPYVMVEDAEARADRTRVREVPRADVRLDASVLRDRLQLDWTLSFERLDREIASFDGRVMVLRFTDPEVAGRYGTGVYVRCAPRA